jgi:hypothetical protein
METPKVKKIKTLERSRFEVANKTSQDLFHHEDSQKPAKG